MKEEEDLNLFLLYKEANRNNYSFKLDIISLIYAPKLIRLLVRSLNF